MRRLLIAAATLLLAAAPAFAGDAVMAGYFGNTVVSTGGGIESRTHYKADHTFDAHFAVGGQSLDSKGTWSVDGNSQLCRVYDTPPPGVTNPVCIPAEAHKVGDNWTVTVIGGQRAVTMVAGIQ